MPRNGLRHVRCFPLVLWLWAIATGCGDGFKRDLSSVGSTVVNFSSARTEALNLMDALSSIDLILDGNLISQLRGDLMLLADVSGGLAIYAANADNPALGGRRILTSPGQGSSINWSIPNGNYIFYLVGWSAANMGGNVACGWANTGQPIRLEGGSHTIIMNTFGCGVPPFTGPATGGPLAGDHSVIACDSSETLNALGPGSACATADPAVANFQYAILEYDHFEAPSAPSATAAGLVSACHLEGDTIPPLVTQALVTGTRDFRIRVPMEVKLFTTGSCTTGQFLKTVHFGGGLGGAISGSPFPNSVQQSGCSPNPDRGRYYTSAGNSYVYLKDAAACP